MEKINLQLEANTKEAEKRVEKLNDKVKDTGRSARKAGKDLSAGMQLGNEGVRQLDRLTGGLASKLVAVGKAAKLSGKAMKSALISTGIGAAVVAIGLIVEHWDAIGEALGFINKDLERQKALNDELLTSVDSQLGLLQKEQKYNEQRGIDNAENLEKQKQILIAKDAILKRSIKILQTQLLQEQTAAREVGFWDKINAGFQGFLFGYSKQAEILAKTAGVSTEEQKKLNDLQGELNKLKGEELDLDLLLNPPAEKKKEEKVEVDPAIKEKAKTIEEIAKLEDDYFQKQLDKQTQELNAVSDKYFGLIEKAKQFNLDTAELEAQRKAEEDAINETYRLQAEEKELERLQGIKDIQNQFEELTEVEELEKQQAKDIAKLERLGATEEQIKELKLRYAQEIADAEDEIDNEATQKKKKYAEDLKTAKIKLAGQTLNILGSLAEEGSVLAKGVAVAGAIMNTYQGITKALAESTDPTPTQSLRFASAAAVGVMGFMQVANILKQKPIDKNASRPTVNTGGGGGSAPPMESLPPAFNIVGASGTSQLADAIGGQEQQPVQAYVVASDVSTAQELDRNIIEGASIG